MSASRLQNDKLDQFSNQKPEDGYSLEWNAQALERNTAKSLRSYLIYFAETKDDVIGHDDAK